MKTKIIVCYHKEGVYVTNDVYLPVQVGREKAKVELPIQGDNQGDNISNLNSIYCELTGLYWAWKNVDADYIGLCHYRRFFSYDKPVVRGFIHKLYAQLRNLKEAMSSRPRSFTSISEIIASDERDLAQRACIESKKISQYLNRHSTVRVMALYPINLGFCNNLTHFAMVAGLFHIELVRAIIKKMYPAILEFYDGVLASNKLHLANMTICARATFDEYCRFVFDILEEHRKVIIADGWYANQEEKALSRLSGYIAEILTSTYVTYVKKTYGKKAVKYLSLLRANI